MLWERTMNDIAKLLAIYSDSLPKDRKRIIVGLNPKLYEDVRKSIRKDWFIPSKPKKKDILLYDVDIPIVKMDVQVEPITILVKLKKEK